jgi:hypothetical protein
MPVLRAAFWRDKQPGHEADSTHVILIIGNIRGNLPPCPTDPQDVACKNGKKTAFCFRKWDKLKGIVI